MKLRCRKVALFLLFAVIAGSPALAQDNSTVEDQPEAVQTDAGHAGESTEEGEAASGGHGGGHAVESPIPFSLDGYQAYEEEHNITGVADILKHRIEANQFNLIATVIFFLAIFHTFMAGTFRKLAHKYEHEHEERIKREGRTAEAKPYPEAKDDASFKAEIFHFLGEVEAIFGIWLIPLIAVIMAQFGWEGVTGYFDYLSANHKYTEPLFVVVIMALASTRPVLKFAERVMRVFANFGKGTPAAWWLSILVVAPLLGSFITEPAAMTIAALLLGQQFYKYEPTEKFKYATLGLLFVNISVGGTLTHFAAPPVLMVAGRWGWDMSLMFTNFGWKATVGIVIATTLYYFFFRKEFAALKEKTAKDPNYGKGGNEEPVPMWIIIVMLGFIAWTVMTLHHPPLFVGGFLFFLAFAQATAHHHDKVSLKGPLLVGFFLAGLVTHGTLQQWWIAPVLSSLGEIPLFFTSTILTAFNDNAAITYLASQVPAFDPHLAQNQELASAMRHAVVYGAVTGGGLTVIANAPNPAGQSILQKFFGGVVSPAKLLLGAIIPTIIMGACFLILPNLG